MGSQVEAAGGVVHRCGPDGIVEVVVVYRERYGDWSLPKGKLEKGEQPDDAALREVLEETGLRCAIGHRLPDVRYLLPDGRPKRVRWWTMTVVEDLGHAPDREVQEIRWTDVAGVKRLLVHESDCSTVRAASFLV